MTTLEWILLWVVICQFGLLFWIAIRAGRAPDQAEDFCQWATDRGWDITKGEHFEIARSAYCRQCLLGRRT